METQFTKAAEHLIGNSVDMLITADKVRDFLRTCEHPYSGLRVFTTDALVFKFDPRDRVTEMGEYPAPLELILDQVNHDEAWATLKGYNAYRSDIGEIIIPLYTSKGLITAGAVVAAYFTDNAIFGLTVNDVADDLFNEACSNMREIVLARSVLESGIPESDYAKAFNILMTYSSAWPDECDWSPEEVAEAVNDSEYFNEKESIYTLDDIRDIAHSNTIWYS
jgi:hypothetical protein